MGTIQSCTQNLRICCSFWEAVDRNSFKASSHLTASETNSDLQEKMLLNVRGGAVAHWLTASHGYGMTHEPISGKKQCTAVINGTPMQKTYKRWAGKKTNQKTKTTINTRCRSTPVIVCRQQDVLYVDYALFLCKHTHTHTPENYMTSVLSRLPLLMCAVHHMFWSRLEIIFLIYFLLLITGYPYNIFLYLSVSYVTYTTCLFWKFEKLSRFCTEATARQTAA